MNILLVEDENKIAAFIEEALSEDRYRVSVAKDGEQALERAMVDSYDLVILDIMIPKKDGFSVCKELREKGEKMPILFLTAKGDLHDKIKGLDLGADDYLTKPFEIEELLARVRALIRRDKDQKSPVLELADLKLDQATRKVERSGKPVNLTSREYALLRYLMIHANEVVTRTMITEHVWGEHSAAFTNVIDVYINYLRKKIDKDFKPPLIHTIRSVGYIMKIPDEA